MRIIAGSRARLTLIPPKDASTTRPITDRVKEALFSIVQFELAEARVADLFCGTGSLGLEALSRGAAEVLFADADADAVRRLQQNITRCRFTDQAAVRRGDVFRLAGQLTGLFDLVFVDPPYALSRHTDTASDLGRLLKTLSDRVAPDGRVIIRHEKQVTLESAYGSLGLQQRREYGTMALTFLEPTGEPTEKS